MEWSVHMVHIRFKEGYVLSREGRYASLYLCNVNRGGEHGLFRRGVDRGGGTCWKVIGWETVSNVCWVGARPACAAKASSVLGASDVQTGRLLTLLALAERAISVTCFVHYEGGIRRAPEDFVAQWWLTQETGSVPVPRLHRLLSAAVLHKSVPRVVGAPSAFVVAVGQHGAIVLVQQLTADALSRAGMEEILDMQRATLGLSREAVREERRLSVFSRFPGWRPWRNECVGLGFDITSLVREEPDWVNVSLCDGAAYCGAVRAVEIEWLQIRQTLLGLRVMQ